MQSEVKDKAKHGIQNADRKVDEGVDAIEQSKVGKSLPTHIEKVEFKDIVYGFLLLNIILTIPVYLQVSAYLKSREGQNVLFGKICQYSIIFTGAFGITFDAVVLMMKKAVMLKVSMIMKAMKGITILGLMFILSVNGKVAKCLQILYLLGVIAADAIFLYYAAIYLKRINQEPQDGKSVKK